MASGVSGGRRLGLEKNQRAPESPGGGSRWRGRLSSGHRRKAGSAWVRGSTRKPVWRNPPLNTRPRICPGKPRVTMDHLFVRLHANPGSVFFCLALGLAAQTAHARSCPIHGTIETNESFFRKLDTLPTPCLSRRQRSAGPQVLATARGLQDQGQLDDAAQKINRISRTSPTTTIRRTNCATSGSSWTRTSGSRERGPQQPHAAIWRPGWRHGQGLSFPAFASMTKKDRADGFHIHFVKDAKGAPLHTNHQ